MFHVEHFVCFQIGFANLRRFNSSYQPHTQSSQNRGGKAATPTHKGWREAPPGLRADGESRCPPSVDLLSYAPGAKRRALQKERDFAYRDDRGVRGDSQGGAI